MFVLASFKSWKIDASLNREEKEKIIDRMKSSSCCGFLLTGISLIAITITLFLKSFNFKIWDYYFIGSNIILFILFIILFKKTSHFIMKENENPIAKEWETKK